MLRRAMKAKQTGFTLIELMFTIVVLAVLLGIGVPNFRDFVRNSRLTAAANDLLADVNLARSEAVKRRVPVTLCKSANGTDCAAAAAAFTGWIVFVDDANPLVDSSDDGNGVVNASGTPSEQVLVYRRLPELQVRSDGVRQVFRPSGFPNPGATERLTRIVLCDARKNIVTSGGASAARGLTISPTGHAAVTRDIATITAMGGCPT